MAAPSITLLLDNVGVNTVEHKLDGLIDNFFTSSPFMARLMSEDRISVEGGKEITQRIIYQRKPGGSYSGLDTFDTSKRETRTEMRFSWKQYYVDLTIDGLSLLQNSGPEAIHDIVSDDMDEADMSAMDYVSDDIFLDGTGNGSKALTGLRAVVDNGDTVATYGGITRATGAGTPGLAVSGNIVTAATTFSLATMNTHYGTATIGNEKPNLIVTTQTLWDKFWERAQPSQRFAAGDPANSMAGLGFDTVRFNRADVVVDDKCPASHVYMLNTKFMKLVVHSKRLWDFTGWKYPTNQDAAIGQILFAGELVCKSPRLQIGLTNVS